MVAEEVPEECLFGPTEAPACERAVVQPIIGMEAENRINGSNEEGNFPVIPLGKFSNPTKEDMAVLCCIGIIIDYNNDPVP